MCCYGKINGTDAGLKGTWLIELDANGVPTPDFILIPAERMPDVTPSWSIQLLKCGDAEFAFTGDESGRIGMMKMIQRRIAELRGLDVRS